MTAWKSALQKCHPARAFRVAVVFCACICAALMMVVSLRSESSPVTGSQYPVRQSDFLSMQRRQNPGSKHRQHYSPNSPNNSDVRDKMAAPCTQACYITTGVSGRLGNQMFEYASLLGIADLNNRTEYAFYPQRSALETAFRITRVHSRSAKGYEEIDENSFASYDPKFERLPPKNALIMQYFQSWKYFHHIKDTILKEFTFLPNVQKSAETLIEKLTQNHRNKTKVGIHVRRGDMVLQSEIRKGFRTPPPSYYKMASDHMRTKYHDVMFILVTDDARWCQSNLNFKDTVIADGAPPPVHLAVLAACDHVIMSAGTFSWWGGYLAGGDVIYYAKEMTPNTLAGSGLSPSDHYLPHWTALDD